MKESTTTSVTSQAREDIAEHSFAILYGSWKPWFDCWFELNRKDPEIDFGVTILKVSIYFWWRKHG